MTTTRPRDPHVYKGGQWMGYASQRNNSWKCCPDCDSHRVDWRKTPDGDVVWSCHDCGADSTSGQKCRSVQ